MNTQLQLEQAYMQVAESTGVNEAIPLAKIGRGAMSTIRFVGKHGRDVIAVANALIALVDAVKKDKESSVKITDSIENAVEKARELKKTGSESQTVNEDGLDSYTTHGELEVKPYRDVSSWNDHGSFRNRPIIMTKDTPAVWADDTKTAANITKDALITMAPVPGGAAASAIGRGMQTVGKALPAAEKIFPAVGRVLKPVMTTAGKVVKPIGNVAGKAGIEVAKGGAKAAGTGAAVVGGGYVAAKKIGDELKKRVDDIKTNVKAEIDKFKAAPGEYVSDVGNKVLTHVKNAGQTALNFAKTHPYATAAIAATPLLVYGGKKAYDYFKDKFGDSEEEKEAAESCDESSIAIDESVFDNMIEKMEGHGFSFEDAGNDAIVFNKDGEIYAFNSWQEVEDCIADLDAGHENIFEDAPTAAPANTAAQPQQKPVQQTTAQQPQQAAQPQQTATTATIQQTAQQPTAQQPQQAAQPQQKPVQQPQQAAQPKPVQATSESKKNGIKVKNCTDFKTWKAKMQF